MSKETTCENCINGNVCIMYEPKMKRCKDYIESEVQDADALNFNADYNEPLISKLDFGNAPTIIEADKEGVEE